MVEIMQIRSADTAGLDGDLDLSRTDYLGFAFLDPQIAGSMNDDSFHVVLQRHKPRDWW